MPEETALQRAAAVLAGLAVLTTGCGQEPDSPAPEASEPVLAAEEVDALRSLGYVDVVEEEDGGEVGVLLHDPERSQAGLVYFTSVQDCSSHLITREGEILRSWRQEPCEKWGNTILLPSGEVLAIHHDPVESERADRVAEARRLLRLGWNGELLWSRRLPVHHDLTVQPDGSLLALTYVHHVLPEAHPTAETRDHFIAELSPEGELLREVSLTQMLLEADAAGVLELQPVKARPKHGILELDLVHSNSIEVLRQPEGAPATPFFTPDHLLLCLRHQDMVLVVDWPAGKIVWAWGPGELSGPHDATLLENGNILVFDNGISRRWSRVIELDPREERIVWEYRGPRPREFFTLTRGAAQRLPDGNTLITLSGAGALVEVTPAGEQVWLYKNPWQIEGEQRSAIVRARNVLPADGPPFGFSD